MLFGPGSCACPGLTLKYNDYPSKHVYTSDTKSIVNGF